MKIIILIDIPKTNKTNSSVYIQQAIFIFYKLQKKFTTTIVLLRNLQFLLNNNYTLISVLTSVLYFKKGTVKSKKSQPHFSLFIILALYRFSCVCQAVVFNIVKYLLLLSLLCYSHDVRCRKYLGLINC